MKVSNPLVRNYKSGTRLVFAVTLLALFAVAGIIAFQAPGTPGTSEVAAAPVVNELPQDGEVATRAMIDYALNFKAAANFAVFGGRGIQGLENSTVRGNAGNNSRNGDGLAARNDLARSLDALWQLPCSELEGTNLTGRTITPGVYCMPGADLSAGQVIFDAQGDSSAIFIVRSEGGLSTDEGTVFALAGGARASNIYFVTRDGAEIASGGEFKGNIITESSINAGTGSDIDGKTLALGEVVLNESSLGQGTGVIQICKALAPGAVDISNRIFNFTITGVAGTIAVPVGSCSNPIEVPIGSQTITELNTGQTITGGTFAGNFQLVGVDVITPLSTSTLGAVNLATRTAVVNVAEGGTAQQLTLRFTNQYAITGFVEICKQAAANDPDVSGFFTFTVEGVFTTNTQSPPNRTLQQFVAPVGQCTGPIAVTITNPTGADFGTVRVSELPRPGFFLESVNTFPVNRELAPEVLGSIVNANGQVVAAPGGGYATVRVNAGTTPANETLVNFVNRSAPGLFKVCKIAGPGVPVNTLFRFRVVGTGATAASTNPQTAMIGEVERFVDVRAGAPETGGTCAFVPGFGGGVGGAEFQTFVNGTPVRVWELGLTPNVSQPTQPGGTLLTSRILSTSGFFPGIFNPNPDLTPGVQGETAYISRVAVPARGGVVEVEFTNFRFNPAALKVCKIGAGGVSGNFTFDVTLVGPTSPNGPIFPTSTTTVTATAGPAEQGGFCALVNAANFPGGGLNAGTTINIVERAVANTQVTAVACPTCLTGGLTFNLGTRTATLTGANGLRGGEVINTVTFTNGPAAGAPSALRALYDFDGDGSSDPSIYRASTGTWWYAASSANGQHRAVNFGLASDRIVPADYDGDGKTDFAIYRSGEWHILGSTMGYRVYHFGIATDTPAMGDWDGDGRADLAVYRASEGRWYVNQSGGATTIVQFGISTDIPVAADYDGDGRTDFAVYRDGIWYMLRSTEGFGAMQFGLAGDRPVVADYDGDRKADQAVYRNGVWHLLRSNGGYLSTQFGLATDIPVEADYDGDGRTDLAVFRPSDGVWHILRSSQTESNYSAIPFGLQSDTPVPTY